MINAAKQVARWLDLLTEEVIAPNEFADQFIRDMLLDEACDPAAILRGLPVEARSAVLELIHEYQQKDFLVAFFYLGPGESPHEAIDRQPKLRNLCRILLGA